MTKLTPEQRIQKKLDKFEKTIRARSVRVYKTDNPNYLSEYYQANKEKIALKYNKEEYKINYDLNREAILKKSQEKRDLKKQRENELRSKLEELEDKEYEKTHPIPERIVISPEEKALLLKIVERYSL